MNLIVPILLAFPSLQDAPIAPAQDPPTLEITLQDALRLGTAYSLALQASEAIETGQKTQDSNSAARHLDAVEVVSLEVVSEALCVEGRHEFKFSEFSFLHVSLVAELPLPMELTVLEIRKFRLACSGSRTACVPANTVVYS